MKLIFVILFCYSTLLIVLTATTKKTTTKVNLNTTNTSTRTTTKISTTKKTTTKKNTTTKKTTTKKTTTTKQSSTTTTTQTTTSNLISTTIIKRTSPIITTKSPVCANFGNVYSTYKIGNNYPDLVTFSLEDLSQIVIYSGSYVYGINFIYNHEMNGKWSQGFGLNSGAINGATVTTIDLNNKYLTGAHMVGGSWIDSLMFQIYDLSSKTYTWTIRMGGSNGYEHGDVVSDSFLRRIVSLTVSNIDNYQQFSITANYQVCNNALTLAPPLCSNFGNEQSSTRVGNTLPDTLTFSIEDLSQIEVYSGYYVIGFKFIFNHEMNGKWSQGFGLDSLSNYGTTVIDLNNKLITGVELLGGGWINSFMFQIYDKSSNSFSWTSRMGAPWGYSSSVFLRSDTQSIKINSLTVSNTNNYQQFSITANYQECNN